MSKKTRAKQKKQQQQAAHRQQRETAVAGPAAPSSSSAGQTAAAQHPSSLEWQLNQAGHFYELPVPAAVDDAGEGDGEEGEGRPSRRDWTLTQLVAPWADRYGWQTLGPDPLAAAMDAIRVADEADETDPLAVLNRLSSIYEQMDELTDKIGKFEHAVQVKAADERALADAVAQAESTVAGPSSAPAQSAAASSSSRVEVDRAARLYAILAPMGRIPTPPGAPLGNKVKYLARMVPTAKAVLAALEREFDDVFRDIEGGARPQAATPTTDDEIRQRFFDLQDLQNLYSDIVPGRHAAASQRHLDLVDRVCEMEEGFIKDLTKLTDVALKAACKKEVVHRETGLQGLAKVRQWDDAAIERWFDESDDLDAFMRDHSTDDPDAPMTVDFIRPMIAPYETRVALSEVLLAKLYLRADDVAEAEGEFNRYKAAFDVRVAGYVKKHGRRSC